ncbi:hypothetical protein DFH08DRAFT_811363 [Mycena albidolilacea]|uniref:Uncharacterized protein n=1 Tax=Mycena albidolilacea TaxID=1033008 RepID=A0AAD6ZWM6_9AGAR|nr:hypothetical protein DFH08DRAFT_811363 [Mycena albidolilacea]
MAEATSAIPRPTSTNIGQLPLDRPGRASSANLDRPQPTSIKSAEGPSKCTRPRDPELDNMTYVEFGSKCRLERHDSDVELHLLQVLEDKYPGRPRMRIRFYDPNHVGEAAGAMGLFNNCDEGIMVFEELLKSGAPLAQLRWIFAVLAVEGSPELTIWGAHECEFSADIKDSMQRVTPAPPAEVVRNELLLALEKLLQGLGSHYQKLDCQSLQNGNKKSMLSACAGVVIQVTLPRLKMR